MSEKEQEGPEYSEQGGEGQDLKYHKGPLRARSGLQGLCQVGWETTRAALSIGRKQVSSVSHVRDSKFSSTFIQKSKEKDMKSALTMLLDPLNPKLQQRIDIKHY